MKIVKTSLCKGYLLQSLDHLGLQFFDIDDFSR